MRTKNILFAVLKIFREKYLEIASGIKNIESISHSTVYISGASGLLGTSLVLLLQSLRISGLDLNLILAGRKRDRLLKTFGDTCFSLEHFDSGKKLTKEIQADFIIHLAADAEPEDYRNQPAKVYSSIYDGAKNILSKTPGSSRFVFVSSSEVYPVMPNFCLLDEECRRGNLTGGSYSLGKQNAEKLVRAAGEEIGLDTVIIRPEHIYGAFLKPGSSKAAADFLYKVLDNEPVSVKNPVSVYRNYNYAIDCASGVLTAMINGVKGESYNCASAECAVRLDEFAREFAVQSGMPFKWSGSPQAGCRDYRLLSGKKLESIGWRPLYNIQRGVAETLEIAHILKRQGMVF